MSPVIRLSILAVAWLLWVLPFFLNRARGQGKAVKVDPRARLGILLVGLGFFLANKHRPEVWGAPVELWRALLGMAFAAVAIALAWMAVGNLGRQWRVDAGLNADHELVQTGAYRLVRHPIYLSILCMLSMFVAMIGTLPGLAVRDRSWRYRNGNSCPGRGRAAAGAVWNHVQRMAETRSGVFAVLAVIQRPAKPTREAGGRPV